MGISRSAILMVYGIMKHVLQYLLYVLMTLRLSDDDANHLTETLKNYYSISLDREGRNHSSLALHWNYKEGCVDVDMPQYVSKNYKTTNIQHLKNHNMPLINTINRLMAKKTQFAPEPDKTTHLNAKDKKWYNQS